MDLFSPHQLGNLNEPEMLVYRYIMEHPNTVPFMRIRELAAEAHVSTTTVLHFCKKMGCDAVGKDNIISAAHCAHPLRAVRKAAVHRGERLRCHRRAETGPHLR